MPELTSTPQFVGIGAQRCATTWLAQCLGEHPDIFLPAKKEIQFFDVHFDQGVEWYANHFKDREPSQIWGEYTPDYLPNSKAMERIAVTAPDARLIVLLRDPVERAASAFKLFRSRGRITEESLEFAIRSHGHLISYGRYFEQIKHVYRLFPCSQVKIFLYDDITSNPHTVLGEAYGWLGVDENFKAPSGGQIANLSLSPWLQEKLDNNQWIRTVANSPIGTALKHLRKRGKSRTGKRREETTIGQGAERILRDELSDDTLSLSKMLDRDLSHWRSHPNYVSTL